MAEQPTPTLPSSTPSEGRPPENAGTNPAATDSKEAKTQQEKAAVTEAVEQLRRALPSIAETDKGLAQTVERLVRESSDPLRANHKSFHHDVAYAVEDVGRTGVGTLNLSEPAQFEMARLAASAPGLESVGMQDLMQSTAAMADRALIRDIRNRAFEIGQQADQNTPDIRSQIEVLENRTRLASKVEAGSTPSGPRDNPAHSDAPTQRDQQAPHETAKQGQNQRHFLEGAATAPGNGFFRMMRGNGASTTPPWEAAPTPFGARLSAFEDKMAQGRDDVALRGVEKSGHAAMEALEGFKHGEGAVMLNRIRTAAQNDPGGMAGVLSEMREGGKFADLRQQFNNALADEKGVSAAYDKAAAALARYGQDRVAAEQIIARRPDAANLSAKFETMDKDIGQAAGEMPSRRDGKTMLEDLSKQVAEMLQRAVESVKNLFNRGPAQTASAGPSPS